MKLLEERSLGRVENGSLVKQASFAVLEDMPQGILVTQNGTICFANQKIYTLFQHGSPLKKYKKMSSFFRRYPSVIACLREGEQQILSQNCCLSFKKHFLFSKDTGGRYFLIRAFRFFSDEKLVCWIFEDITVQKEKEIFEQYQETSFCVFELLRSIDVKEDKYTLLYRLLDKILKQYRLKTAIFLEQAERQLVCSFLVGEDRVFPHLFKKLSVFDSQVCQSAAYQAMIKKKPVGYRNIMQQSFYRRYLKRVNEKQILSTYAFPVIINKCVEGVISLYSYQEDFFSPIVVRQLSQLVSEICLFIEETQMKFGHQSVLEQYETKLQKQIQALKENKRILQKQAEETNKIVADLVLAQHQAEVANRSKMNFLANVSHELRTPLNAILGFTQAMQNEIFGPLSVRYKEYTGFIFSSANHLLSLINDILDLSKMEAGRFSLIEEAVDLKATLQEAIALVEQYPYEGKRFITLHPMLPLILLADGRALKQIFLNVLSNAVKFTKDGGHVDIFITLTNEFVRLVFQDDGIGVPKEKIKQLFQPFSQIENIFTRTHTGSGLGLVLVKKMVILHQGAVRMESDNGTRIIIDLPRSRVISSGD